MPRRCTCWHLAACPTASGRWPRLALALFWTQSLLDCDVPEYMDACPTAEVILEEAVRQKVQLIVLAF